jgi:adenosylmethionine-8-amino-7-oxononanoate aminotransferase
MDSNSHADSLSRDALRHLWLHFTGMGDLDPDELQIIVRGEGCYLEDEHGRRYLDALAGLFCVNAGYSHGAEMGEAAASQMRELPFAINWTFAHPRSIELAAELARLAPGALSRLLELPIVGDLRGSGYFYALELVKDSDSRESFSDDECNELLRGFLSPELFRRGLICRADDRGDPVVQISPPLVAGPDEFEEIVQILGGALNEACERMAVTR